MEEEKAGEIPEPDIDTFELQRAYESFPIPNLDMSETMSIQEKVKEFCTSRSTELVKLFTGFEGKHSARILYDTLMIHPKTFHPLTGKGGVATTGLEVSRHMSTITLTVWLEKTGPKFVNKTDEPTPGGQISETQPSVDEIANGPDKVDTGLGFGNPQERASIHINWQAAKLIHVINLSEEKVAQSPIELEEDLASKPTAFREFIKRAKRYQAVPYLVDVHFDPALLAGEFFQVNIPASALRFVSQVKTGNVKLLILGSPKTFEQLEILTSVFAYQTSVRSKSGYILSDPLRLWHHNPGRMTFKEDSMVPDNDDQQHGYRVHYSFHGLNHVLTILGISMLQEQIVLRKQRHNYENKDHAIPLIEVPNGHGRIYFTWLPYPSDEESKFRLQPGDRLKAVFHNPHKPNFDDDGWGIQILGPIAYGPSDMIPALVKRRTVEIEEIDPDTGEKTITRTWDPNPVRTIQLTGNLHELAKTVMTAPVNKCKITIRMSDKIFRQNFSSIERVFCPSKNDPDTQSRVDWRTILNGNGFDHLTRRNGIAHITEQFPDLKERKDFILNTQQARGVDSMTKALGGVCIINGLPGCGKTYMHKQVIGVQMKLDKHYTAVVATNTNEGVDKLCSEYKAMLLKGQKSGSIPNTRYVVRLHSNTTENVIRDSFAVQTRQAKISGRKPLQYFCDEDDVTTEEFMAELSEIAVYLGGVAKNAEKPKFEGIHDKRVTHLVDSAAYLMLKKAGIIPDRYLFDKTDKYSHFKTMYIAFSGGAEFSKAQKDQFAGYANILFDDVIRDASVVVATNTGLGSATVMRALAPCAKMLVFDEAMAMREQDMLPIAANPFEKLSLILFCGDFFQLEPHVEVDNSETLAFYKQGFISLPSRLARCGFDVTYLTEQNRMNPDIRKIVSAISYGNSLTDAPGVALEKRLKSQLARSVVSTMYQQISGHKIEQKCNVMILDFKGPAVTVKVSPTHSRHCDAFIVYLMNSLPTVLQSSRFDKTTSYAIISPYTEEQNRLITAKATMESLHPELAEPLSRVTVGTIDVLQGHEFDVVWTTLPVTITGGHCNHKRRLAVQLSRAKHLMFILLSTDAIKAARNVSNIKKLLTVAGTVTAKIKLDQLPHCPYYTATKTSAACFRRPIPNFTTGEETGSFDAPLESLSLRDSVAR